MDDRTMILVNLLIIFLNLVTAHTTAPAPAVDGDEDAAPLTPPHEYASPPVTFFEALVRILRPILASFPLANPNQRSVRLYYPLTRQSTSTTPLSLARLQGRDVCLPGPHHPPPGALRA